MDVDRTRQSLTVLGAGSWGTALACLLAGSGHDVTLWDRSSSLVGEINKHQTNSRYLPSSALPSGIAATAEMSLAVTLKTTAVIVAVPSHAIRDVTSEIASVIAAPTVFISAAKGLEAGTGMTMTEIIASLLPTTFVRGMVALSGPNLAQEVVRGIPTVCISAGKSPAIAQEAQQMLMSKTFRVYTHSDVRGVELAGALKNVLAIGAGVCEGLGYGDNTKAAMMTRGLMEMTQIGVAGGAQAMTFLGIAGVGDLMATAAGKLSRNFRVGLGLAEGKSLTEILASIGQAAEGVPTSVAAYGLARKYKVDTPLFDTIHDVIYKGLPPASAVIELMTRPPKDEAGGL
jgi:glycerol-3-phosphate dehydrogenase (NAD(P)+)